MADTEWKTDFEAALGAAAGSGKEVQINFTAAPL